MFAAITLAGLLAAVPADAVMQWNMQATSSGRITFETQYRAVTAEGNTSDTDSQNYDAVNLESTFPGLTHAQLFGPGSDVRFTITRQEGTIACTGHARGGIATGDFTVALDPRFSAELQRRGVGAVSPERQMEWLFEGGDVYGMLDYFKGQGYPVPSVRLLSEVIDHGVTVQYARDLASAGMRASTIEQLVRARDHGVTRRYLAAIAAYGFHDLTLDQTIALVDHGVSPAYLSALGQLGYRVTPDQAIQLADHGVTARYIAKLRSDGYSNLSVSDLVRLADHGVH